MDYKQFWGEVFSLRSGISPGIRWRMLAFGAIAIGVWALCTHTTLIPPTEVAPYELIGAALAVLLMLRTNTGYDRWYEGRKLWGGIVNQSRNLAQIGLAYGPTDPAWRTEFTTWVAAFSHACRHSLRGDHRCEDMRELLGDDLDRLRKAQHMPLYVSRRLAKLLQRAVDDQQMDRFAFMKAEEQRSLLIDHIGACERILKTPLAKALAVKIRRFLVLYLIALPFGIFDKAGVMTPIIVMLVAYPLLSLDQISVELQNPFSTHRLSHLPLDDICRNIEGNVFGLLEGSVEDEEELESEGTVPRIAVG
jgi:putative membrane protein